MTDRLDIVMPTLAHFTAFEQGRLGELIDAEVPGIWPVFPESAALPDEEPQSPWRPYWAVHRADRVLILEGGLITPDEDGQVEFGYGLLPAYRGQGLATEFARRLIDIAAGGHATAVTAHTYPADAVSPEGFPANPSIAVLTRLGFSCIDRSEFWFWRLPI